MVKFTEEEVGKYSKSYSDEGFWDKVKEVGKTIGKTGLGYALTLYFVLQKKDLDFTTKLLIVAALGYLILPVDLIPDMIPVAGFVDDMAALAYVHDKVSGNIDEEVRNNVNDKLNEWFEK